MSCSTATVSYTHLDVPADVESAGEVIERDGADAGHEDALEHALEHLEYITVEAAGVGERCLLYTSQVSGKKLRRMLKLIQDE